MRKPCRWLHLLIAEWNARLSASASEDTMKTKTHTRDWWLNARIGYANDGRRHITDEDKDYIRALHKQGEPIREIARIFEGICSRRSIQLVLFPERYERIKARAKEVKRWTPYNTKEYHTPAMRKYRTKLLKIHNNK